MESYFETNYSDLYFFKKIMFLFLSNWVNVYDDNSKNDSQQSKTLFVLNRMAESPKTAPDPDDGLSRPLLDEDTQPAYHDGGPWYQRLSRWSSRRSAPSRWSSSQVTSSVGSGSARRRSALPRRASAPSTRSRTERKSHLARKRA